MNGFYYLHADGNLIYKPEIVVANDDGYFDSPFVKKVWHVDPRDRIVAWKIILEALAMGCDKERAKELSKQWDLTFEDSLELLSRTPKDRVTPLMIEGLDIFIVDILGMTVDDYWKSVRERDDKGRLNKVKEFPFHKEKGWKLNELWERAWGPKQKGR